MSTVSLGSGASPAPLLSGTSISKAYGGVPALLDVSVSLYAGEVHVLAGENGSGKSTLLRILSGALKPDAGVIQLSGSPVEFGDVRSAMRVGVTRISQELSLAPDLSVAENIFMGHGKSPLNRIDRRSWEERSSEILETLGAHANPRTLVGGLPPDQRQLVEIARALSHTSKVLFLDEPTSSLDTQESDFLFDVMGRLAASGVALVFISHRLPEMLTMGDRFTVLRDGHVVGTGVRGDVDHEWLITRMVGREIRYQRAGAYAAPDGADALIVAENVSDKAGKVRNATLCVGPGEVVGLAGLVGSGKTELLELLGGVRGLASGSLRIAGEDAPGDLRGLMRLGVGFVPEDRKGQGIVPEMSVAGNIALSPRASLLPVPRQAERKDVVSWFAALGIRGSASQPVATLSGGNQQKAVLARVLRRSPRVLLLDEPTRGVDIGAKADIYELVAKLSSEGVAVILASSELPEILAVSTRVIVMHAGGIAADLPFQGLTEEKIIAIATGMM